MKCKTSFRGTIFAAAGGIGWGLSGVCSQYLFSHYSMDSSWLTAVRMLLSGALLLGISGFRQKDSVVGILKDPNDRKSLIYFAIVGLLLCQYAFLSAIQHSNSGTATVLQSLSVVMLSVFWCVKTRRFPDKTRILAIVLAIVGVYLIATNGNMTTMDLSFAGLFWGIMAAVGAVLYTLLSRNIVLKWGNVVVSGWGMLIGGAVLSLFIGAWRVPVSLDAVAYCILAVIVVVGTAGAFALFLQGVSDIGPVKATLIACLEPVTATLISAIWLRTYFSSAAVVGLCLVLATVFLSVKATSDHEMG